MNNKDYIPDTRGTSEHLLRRYKTLQGIRTLMDSNIESLCREFKRLIQEQSVFGLEIRSVKTHKYEVVQKPLKPDSVLDSHKGYEYILCRDDIPTISYIEDDGIYENGQVVLNDGTLLQFEDNNGFFLEGSSLEELLNEDDIIYILDLFLGGIYRDSEGNFD